MKSVLLLVTIVWCVAGCKSSAPGFAQLAAPPPAPTTPKATQDGASDKIRAALEHRRIRNFRLFFQAGSEIKEMEDGRECLVRLGWNPSRTWVVALETDVSLQGVMKRSLGGEYEGQLRVISRDRIVQTTIVGFNPSEATQIQVHPGDLIFVQGRD